MPNYFYSYDVWDTIIKRNCEPSYTLKLALYWLLIDVGELGYLDEVFLELKSKEKELLSQHRQYYISDLVFDILQSRGIFSFNEKEQFCLRWESIYFHVEKKCTFKNDEVINKINNDVGEQCYISDFYTNRQFIDKLLAYHNVRIKVGYVSADYDASKINGDLYDIAVDSSNKEWIHTGDNVIADIKMAKVKGASTRRVKVDRVKVNIKKHIYSDYDKIALILLKFCFEIIETACNTKSRKIYFFTREGVFFKKIFDIFVQSVPSVFDKIETIILPTSRIASSCLRFDPESECFGFSHACEQYGYSTSTFLSFFNLDGEYKSLIHKYPTVNELYNNRYDYAVVNLADEVIDLKKKALDYLQSIGLGQDNSIVVDIGWRGSIQDNFMTLKDSKIKAGVYLGLFEFYVGQNLNQKKSAIFDENIKMEKWQRKGVGLWETIFNAQESSVIGYSDKGEIIRKNDTLEQQSFKQTEHMQQNITSSFVRINELFSTGVIPLSMANEYAIGFYKEIVTNPSSFLSDYYLSSTQNETFGLNKFVSRGFNIELKDVIKCVYSQTSRMYIKKRIQENGWRMSIIKSSKTSLLTKLMALLIV